jgi:Response regulator containing a CheY-like receiver domain and an HTH DNA-binding domain
MNSANGSARRKQQEPATYEADDLDVQLLIRHLVKHVTDRSAATPAVPESGLREIILDEEVDGIRCLLVRLQARPERAQVMLSPREQEIARMVAEGYPNKTIAAVLDISSWTVCTHLRRIFAKLNVRSRAAMVAQLLEEGLIKDHSKHYEVRTASLK